MNYQHWFRHVFDLYAPIAGAVFAIVCLLLAFALIRYRAGRGHEPSKKSKHSVLEPLYAVIVACLATFLVVYTLLANGRERTALSRPAMVVTITGFRWCWAFHYDSTLATVQADCNPGLPTLVLPEGENIELRLVSNDVVHEWWVPGLDWKEMAFPGHYNVFYMSFSRTGVWRGVCSEFCGLYHDRMGFFVRVESPSAYKVFLSNAGAGAGTISLTSDHHG